MIDWVIKKWDSSFAAVNTTFFVETDDEEVAPDEEEEEEIVKTDVGETVSIETFVEFALVDIFLGVTLIAVGVVVSTAVSCCKK